MFAGILSAVTQGKHNDLLTQYTEELSKNTTTKKSIDSACLYLPPYHLVQLQDDHVGVEAYSVWLHLIETKKKFKVGTRWKTNMSQEQIRGKIKSLDFDSMLDKLTLKENDVNAIHLHNTVASPFFGNFSCNHALEIATVVVKKAFNDNNLCKNMLSKLTVCVGTQPMSAMKVMGFGYDSMAYDRFNGMDAFAGYLISVLKCNNLFTSGSNTLLHPLLSGWDTNKRLELARPERLNYMLCELFKDMDSVKQYFTESSELFDLANNDFKNKHNEDLALLAGLNNGQDVCCDKGGSQFMVPATRASFAKLYEEHPDATVIGGATDVGPVSYTHLTLPTKRIV